MDRMSDLPAEGRCLEGRLLDELKRHPNGIDAQSLTETLVARGCEPYDVQRAIRRALDGGRAEVGAKLRLFPSLIEA